jgi:hypothetical protein
MLSAAVGFPPIAYTSDSAFAAATRPKSRGPSTIGVKKSVVSTSASSSDSLYTGRVVRGRAATSTFGS